MIRTLKGFWTFKDVQDIEDNLEPERFQKNDKYVWVAYRSPNDTSGWFKNPLYDNIFKREKHDF
jgi:hypothetical protein